MQSTDNLTRSSLLTYEHRAILQNNFPKTLPQFLPGVYDYNSRNNLFAKIAILNQFWTTTVQCSILISLIDHWLIWLCEVTEIEARLAQPWTPERPQVPEQSRDLGWGCLTDRCMYTSWHLGIQSWEGRIVSREMATFHLFCLVSIRKHYQCPIWVQWHSVFLQRSLRKCTVYSDSLWINMLWHCPSQMNYFLNMEHSKIKSGKSAFRTWWSIFFLLLEQIDGIYFHWKKWSTSCRIVSNSLKIYWTATRQVILKTLKTSAELCCARGAEGQAVPPHNVKKQLHGASCSSH